MSGNVERPVMSRSPRPIRLLIVNTVKTAYNGQTMFILKYLRAMDLSGMQIAYVSVGTPEADMQRALEEMGVNVHVLYGRGRHPLHYVRKLASVVRRGQFSIVHAHGNSATLGLEMLAARLGGAKTRIAHSHNTFTRYPRVNLLMKPIFHAMTNTRMACGKAAGRWLFGKRPFEIIPIASDSELFRFDPKKRARARRALGLPEDTLLVGMVAVLTPVKNHEFLLQAFYRARLDNPNLKLILIGDGAMRDLIEHVIERMRLQDAVIMTGAVADVPDRMQAMDALALPSLHEGFPNVLVEAQQSGLPVLVSDRVTRECDLTGLLTYLPLEKSAWVKALSALEVNDRPAASAEACARIDEKGFGLKAAAERLRQRYISFKK